MLELVGKLVAALLFAASFCASANTFTTDASDLWWNPSESGWGVNFMHQADTIFATLFVYTTSGDPAWYVAPNMSSSSGTIFSGPLYQTRGPWFGGTFDPATVTPRSVGTATFTYQSPASGTFTYSVDGVSVSKSITRQTAKLNNLAGSYLGTFVGTYTGCGADGYAEETVELQVGHTDAAISIEARFATETCTYAGTYAQSGRMGAITASVDCGNGPIGPFLAFELEGTTTIVGGRATASYGSCRWAGRIGAVRRIADQ